MMWEMESMAMGVFVVVDVVVVVVCIKCASCFIGERAAFINKNRSKSNRTERVCLFFMAIVVHFSSFFFLLFFLKQIKTTLTKTVGYVTCHALHCYPFFTVESLLFLHLHRTQSGA
jgi:hypothetical protein